MQQSACSFHKLRCERMSLIPLRNPQNADADSTGSSSPDRYVVAAAFSSSSSDCTHIVQLIVRRPSPLLSNLAQSQGVVSPALLLDIAMSDIQKTTFQGSCHCKAVTFTVHLPNGLKDNGTCDCSHCSKRGIIWQFAEPGDFELEKGQEKLKGYQFGAKTTTHQVGYLLSGSAC
jgi:hypothetical protein